MLIEKATDLRLLLTWTGTLLKSLLSSPGLYIANKFDAARYFIDYNVEKALSSELITEDLYDTINQLRSLLIDLLRENEKRCYENVDSELAAEAKNVELLIETVGEQIKEMDSSPIESNSSKFRGNIQLCNEADRVLSKMRRILLMNQTIFSKQINNSLKTLALFQGVFLEPQEVSFIQNIIIPENSDLTLRQILAILDNFKYEPVKLSERPQFHKRHLSKNLFILRYYDGFVEKSFRERRSRPDPNLIYLVNLNVTLNNYEHSITIDLFSIHSVDLSNCDLDEIENDAFQMVRNLSELNLSNNKLKKFKSNEIDNIESVMRLVLNSNQIEQTNFSRMVNLTSLYLDDNKIHQVESKVFENLAYLRELCLSENGIKKLEQSTFQSLTQLRKLYLNKNLLSDIPENLFETLENLEALYMFDNHIVELAPKTFANQSKLEILDLHRNKLEYIDEPLLEKMTALKYLDLHENRLVGFHTNALKNNVSLVKIDISMNSIKHLEPRLFVHLTKLQYFSLIQNSLDNINEIIQVIQSMKLFSLFKLVT